MDAEIAVYSDANAFGSSAAILSALTGEGVPVPWKFVISSE